MEKELQQKLEEIAFRLQRLTDDYHELLNELSQMDEVKKSKKVIYEQYICERNKDDNIYTIKSNTPDYIKVINFCKSHYKHYGVGKYTFYKRDILLSQETTKIIETYIPSKNIVLVVEL